MTDNKKNDDIFLQSIGKVVPLKKNKNFKQIKKVIIKIKNKTNEETKIETTTNEKIINKKTNFQIESIPVEKKIKKGKILISKKIDLHGYSVNQARKKFFNEIEKCFYSNKRCILFITGKGSVKKENDHPQDTMLYYGKIRNNFLNWVNHNTVQSKILNVQQANTKTGGDGAFYVYLRKNKN